MQYSANLVAWLHRLIECDSILTCFFVADEPKHCSYDRERLIASGIVNIAFPECDSKGNYKRVQCTYAWGLRCWCADRNGNAYWNTSVYNDDPDCSEQGTCTASFLGILAVNVLAIVVFPVFFFATLV